MKKGLSSILVVALCCVSIISADIREDISQLQKSGKDFITKIKSKIGPESKSPITTSLVAYEKYQNEIAKSVDQKLNSKHGYFTTILQTLHDDLGALEKFEWRDSSNNNTAVSSSAKKRMLQDIKKQIDSQLFGIKSSENLTVTEIIRAEGDLGRANFAIEEMKRLQKKDQKYAVEFREVIQFDPEKFKADTLNYLKAQNEKNEANLNRLKALAAQVDELKKRYLAPFEDEE